MVKNFHIFFFLLLFALSSCKATHSVEYTEKEVVKKEKLEVHDTITNNVHDSIFHTIFQVGDTIYNTKYVEKTKWRERVVYLTDTIYNDSVRIERVKEVVTERYVPEWCYYSLGISFLFILIFAIKIVLWLKK